MHFTASEDAPIYYVAAGAGTYYVAGAYRDDEGTYTLSVEEVTDGM